MWPEQERRDRSERQGELGAEMTDNRKRVRIQQVGNDGEDMEVLPVDKGKGKEVVVLDGENELADRRGAAAGPEEDPGTHRGDSGVENPVGRVNPVDTEQEPPAKSVDTEHEPWCLKRMVPLQEEERRRTFLLGQFCQQQRVDPPGPVVRQNR